MEQKEYKGEDARARINAAYRRTRAKIQATMDAKKNAGEAVHNEIDLEAENKLCEDKEKKALEEAANKVRQVAEQEAWQEEAALGQSRLEAEQRAQQEQLALEKIRIETERNAQYEEERAMRQAETAKIAATARLAREEQTATFIPERLEPIIRTEPGLPSHDSDMLRDGKPRIVSIVTEVSYQRLKSLTSDSPRSAKPATNSTAVPVKRKSEAHASSSTVSPITPFSTSSPEPAQLVVAGVPTALNLSSLGQIRIPKRQKTTNTASPTPPITSPRSPSDVVYERTDPRATSLTWYHAINPNRAGPLGERAMITRCRCIRNLIDRCQKENPPTGELLNEVREELHDLEFFKVTGAVVRKARLLHDENGLPRIFNERHAKGVVYPWDIRSDANELYNKWANQIFDPYLLRGMLIGQSKSNAQTGKIATKARKNARIHPSYKHKEVANYFGNGNLVNGQWWPSQLTALRDGTHGSSQGGIYGIKGQGACSILMAGSHVADVDKGDNVKYQGTPGKDFGPSGDTQLLIDSFTTRNPVRVLRNMKLGLKSKYGPSHGYRYDGLYQVTGYRKLDGGSEKPEYVFNIRRLPGQDPIRYKDIGLGARPTHQEVEEYQKICEAIGIE